jgi:hypothetical protein
MMAMATRGFSGGDRNYKQSKKQAIHFAGPHIFIKSNKVQVHAVQNEFNAHEHRNQIATGEKAVHADKKSEALINKICSNPGEVINQ